MYRLRRLGKKDRRFLGVAGGVSKYLNRDLDPVIIRTTWAVCAILSPFMILLYFVLAFILISDDEFVKDKENGKKENSKKDNSKNKETKTS